MKSFNEMSKFFIDFIPFTFVWIPNRFLHILYGNPSMLNFSFGMIR